MPDFDAILKSKGIEPVASKRNQSTLSKVGEFTGDVAQGVANAPLDMVAGAGNLGMDVTQGLRLDEAVHNLYTGLHKAATGEDLGKFPGSSEYRIPTSTELDKIEGTSSTTSEVVSDLTTMVATMNSAAATNVGKNLLQWANKGNIGRLVLAEAALALPGDAIVSDDSGEFLAFEDDPDGSKLLNRLKSLTEGAALGVLGDFALRGLGKAYRAIRGTGGTADDAIQATFKSTPSGVADEMNKVRPTAELVGDDALANTYIKNPDYKMEVRGDKPVTPNIIKQATRVSVAEFKFRKGVDDRYYKAAETADIPYAEPFPGTTKAEGLRDAQSAVKGTQDREDFLQLFDMWSSGQMTDKVDEKILEDYLRAFTDPLDNDILKLKSMSDEGVKGAERASVMRKVRTKVANNPYLLSPRDFKDKARISHILSQSLGLTPKVPRTVIEVLGNYKKLVMTTDTKFRSALAKMSKNIGVDEQSLLRNMAELDITTDRLSEYVVGLTKLVDTYTGSMATSSQKALAKYKKTGRIDMADPDFQEWLTAAGAASEVYEGVSGIKGNIMRAARMMQENADASARSFTDQFDTMKVKTESAKDTAKSFLEDIQMLTKAAKTAQENQEITEKIIKLLKGSASESKAKRLVSKGLKELADDKDLMGMFISQGIASLLMSPMTLGRIAFSTAFSIGYKQTLIPFWGTIARTKSVPEATKNVVRRWVGMVRVFKNYSSSSRGILGMEIEGMGFSSMNFKSLNAWVSDKYKGKAFQRSMGHLLSMPMGVGNAWMKHGVAGMDDFFRRAVLSAETEGSILEMYEAGMRRGADDIARTFDNFEDYRKSMRPLYDDLRNTLYKYREGTYEEMAEATEKVFGKYSFTKDPTDKIRRDIMEDIVRGERRAAESVAQETASDMKPGKMAKDLSKVWEDTPQGRLAMATLMPFRTAPLNIMRASFEETPGLNLLSARWQRKYKSTDPKDRAEAIAQVMSGMTVLGGAWALVNSTQVYGHIPLEERKAAASLGIQPHSVVIGGSSYSTEVLGPFRAPLSMLADFKRYNQGGHHGEALMKAMGTFMLTATDTPYTNAMHDLTNIIGGEGTEKELMQFFASKTTQFIKPGAGVTRALSPLLNDGAIETSRRATVEGDYVNNWIVALDNNNKSNPAYRFFRSMTEDMPYTTKTNTMGDNLIKNDLGQGGYIPYLMTGTNVVPETSSPGMVLLAELDLINKDFSSIGDVELDNKRTSDVQKRIFSNEGLGLTRVLNALATDEKFMSQGFEYRHSVVSKKLQDHTAQVQGNFSLDIYEKQSKIDDINQMMDYYHTSGLGDTKSQKQSNSEKVYKMLRNKQNKATLTNDKVLDVYK